MSRRVVIAGFGDTGMLVAIHLGGAVDVVGITTKPCLVSGQELGVRLTRPELWKRDYLMSFGSFVKLDNVRRVHGSIRSIDAVERRVHVECPDGTEHIEPYDALVLSSGVRNGFWRNAEVESLETIESGIREKAKRMAAAGTIAVIGGGATGVSAAANFAAQQPEKSIHLFYSRRQPLPTYHPKVRRQIERHLIKRGVVLHPGHRAVIPEGFDCDILTTDLLSWSTGQPPFKADLTLWAVGHTRPNNAFIPAEMLDEHGFVRVDEFLRVPGHENVFAVGDIAASDRNRSSARNWGYRIVAYNLRAYLDGHPARMKRFVPPAHRWGSVLGVQKDGLRVYQPRGGNFRFPRWAVDKLLFPIAVRRIIYKGVRRTGVTGTDE